MEKPSSTETTDEGGAPPERKPPSLDPTSYAQRLRESFPVREPALRAAFASLALPPVSRGLDAGCGIGLQTMLLADVVGPEAEVVGIDISPELLAYARDLVRDSAVAGQITFRQGDIHDLPAAASAFDWLVSVDCAGYPARDPEPLVRELARVVRPGGAIALLAWSSQLMLPGYPLLEARLNATGAGVAPYTAEMPPHLHFLRAVGWMRAAGLRRVTARTFVGEVTAPLSDAQRLAMASLLEMRWDRAAPEVSATEWQEYRRLCAADAPGHILDDPDYYAFFTYTMVQGRIPS